MFSSFLPCFLTFSCPVFLFLSLSLSSAFILNFIRNILLSSFLSSSFFLFIFLLSPLSPFLFFRPTPSCHVFSSCLIPLILSLSFHFLFLSWLYLLNFLLSNFFLFLFLSSLFQFLFILISFPFHTFPPSILFPLIKFISSNSYCYPLHFPSFNFTFPFIPSFHILSK